MDIYEVETNKIVGKAAFAIMGLGSVALIFLKLGGFLQTSWGVLFVIIALSLMLAAVALFIGKYYPDYRYTRYILISTGLLLTLAVNIAVGKPLMNSMLWFGVLVAALLYYDLRLAICTSAFAFIAHMALLYFIDVPGHTFMDLLDSPINFSLALIAIIAMAVRNKVMLQRAVEAQKEAQDNSEKIKVLLKKAGQTSSEIYSLISSADKATDSLAESTETLASLAGDAARRSEKMNTGIGDVAGENRQVETIVDHSRDEVNDMREYSGKTLLDIQNMDDSVKELVSIIAGIQNYTSEIKGISDQVNLLALNAAIEAARAGEHGKGFAVVAEEVRKLSERTVGMVDNINEHMVKVSDKTENMQNTLDGVVKSVSATGDAVDSASGRFNEITEAVRKMSVLMQEVSGMVQEVVSDSENLASVSQEQAATTEEINSQVKNVADAMDKLMEHMEQKESPGRESVS